MNPTNYKHTHTHTRKQCTQLHVHTHTGKNSQSRAEKMGLEAYLNEAMEEECRRERVRCCTVTVLDRRRRVDQRT